MRPQIIALEYHRCRTVLRCQILHGAAIDQNVSVINIKETSDRSEDRGFSTSGWSQHREKFTFPDIHVDVFHSVPVFIMLFHVSDLKFYFFFHNLLLFTFHNLSRSYLHSGIFSLRAGSESSE